MKSCYGSGAKQHEDSAAVEREDAKSHGHVDAEVEANERKHAEQPHRADTEWRQHQQAVGQGRGLSARSCQ